MCFSAPASFIAGGSLALGGGAMTARADKKELIVAVLPLLFGIQQILEGFQWHALNHGAQNDLAAYGFLFFALILWPLYAPTVLLLLDPKRKKAAYFFLAIAVVLTSYFVYLLAVQVPVASVVGHSIQYNFGLKMPYLAGFLYVLATCGAPLSSTVKAFRVFGTVLFVSAAISAVFFTSAFASVWCFFAALLSVMVHFYLKKPRS